MDTNDLINDLKNNIDNFKPLNEEARVIFDIINDLEPVEDKPGYVWYSKRNFQIISIETLRKALADALGCDTSDIIN